MHSHSFLSHNLLSLERRTRATSKYMINGHASTYSEVQTLLKGRGIDLDHDRFLILQVCSLVHPAVSF